MRKRFLRFKKRNRDVQSQVPRLDFYSQLLSLLKAGIPILKALQIILNQSDKKFKQAIQLIIKNLEEGNSLYVSFRKNGFPEEDCNLIRIGEESSNLEKSLAQIVNHLKSSIESKDKIKKALIYPMMVLSLSFAAIIFLLVFILPGFQNIFSEFNFELPFLTVLLLNISKQWFLLLIILTLFIGGSFFLYRREEIKLRLPIVGRIYKNMIFCKICRGLGYQLKSGVPILKALKTLQTSLKSKKYTQVVTGTAKDLEEGFKLSDSLKKSSAFPDSLVQIVRVGEESGSLGDVLVQSSSYYEQQAESFIKKWVLLVEPISTLTVGSVVGLIAISMLLPMFRMLETIQ